MSSGASEKEEVKYNLDKRTQRLVDSAEFKNALNQLRAKVAAEGPAFLRQESKNPVTAPSSEKKVQVVVRKRPLFDYEVVTKGQYDVVTAVHDDRNGTSGMVVSQCRQRIVPRRGIVRELGNFFYPCDQVYDELSSNDEVYRKTARPLLDVASQGGIATCFMFGQTGSGKTHTMSAIQEAVARDVFTLAAAAEKLDVVFFELLGTKCLDLLHDQRQEVKLLADAKGNTNVAGAVRLDLTGQGPDELLQAMAQALSRREVASTGANASSSRSHAIAQLRIGKEGVLTLVDLAGSERKEDSMYHDAKARKEGAEINRSLMSLKECLRVRAERHLDPGKHLHVPYRDSNLTKVLRRALEDPTAFTTVIATCTPAATDAEHTMCTLEAVCRLTGTNNEMCETMQEVAETGAAIKNPELWRYREPGERANHVCGAQVGDSALDGSPSSWSNSTLRVWVQEVEGGRFAACLPKIGQRMSGKDFLRLTETRLAQLFPDGDAVLGADLYKAFRAHIKRVQTEEAARRNQMQEQKSAKYNVASSYSKVFAPKNPNTA